MLSEVASRLAAGLRAGDLIARVGGEEFLAACPGVTEAEALALAERLRRCIAERPFDLPGPDAQSLGVTVSIGLALVSEARAGLAEVLDCADRALLAAKADGRDLVINASRTAA